LRHTTPVPAIFIQAQFLSPAWTFPGSTARYIWINYRLFSQNSQTLLLLILDDRPGEVIGLFTNPRTLAGLLLANRR
jgi:hypothetical protein